MYAGDSADCMISTNFHCHVNRCYVFPFDVFLIFTNCCFSTSYYCTATHLQLMVYRYLPLSPLVFAFIYHRLLDALFLSSCQ
ncbi:hypothetical protein F4604DRAFT_712113 [Suillus subluteus]|nr:hypothetical protein F4604DRAFT_712113 [Suillus subluteus]